MGDIDLGCVKTLEAAVSAQQENRTCGFGESFMRQRRLSRINLAPERPAEWFSHSQDPKPTPLDSGKLKNHISMRGAHMAFGGGRRSSSTSRGAP
jgi:hypothetical protein